jgi:hypothetical protein
LEQWMTSIHCQRQCTKEASKLKTL